MKFATMLAFFAFLCAITVIFAEELILHSPKLTDWGTWSNWDYCPNGTYVIGMQLKSEPDLGDFRDDSALNGIKFYCAEIGSKRTNSTITSGQHRWGSYGSNHFCNNGIATGFQLRSEPDQGDFIDDTAANNLRLYCNGQYSEFIEGDGREWGYFTSLQKCFTKQAFCGLQTQVWLESSWDETAIDNIRVKCCDVPNPTEICVPIDEWELVIECDNTHSTSETTCSYQEKVGVSHSTTESEGGYYEYEVYENIGFSLSGFSSSTGYNWSSSATNVWSVETTVDVSFTVRAGIKAQLFQVVGNCGIYNAKAARFRRNDFNEATQEQFVSYFSY